ncbi:hypothetical protein [Enterobacter cloacae]|uniref:Fimbrial protein n=2 Tax=Enterobacter cloacae TaxID=550 RepID=A0A0H3CVC0_ENTCC|nr:hypothetical protein [Enterobacter cloacae]MBP7743277.1 hypothetical protein [Enterobacter sp.]ADF64605.1 hypothetical protein ECL_05083 [Enterobacter cloacae subsp. cloacae ATCC 13047]KGB13165.1 hypothetical protein DR74_4839 [Enterobacter cloacae]MBW4208823.1 hypothetical protein [Enterobacter cloacae subsp. cloacae]MBW4230302.1 hypothetical protein [Enterobacter cloacae subsp. cloacae]
MSLIIRRTCLLLLACVALSHAPFVLAEEECQVVSSVKSINNGLLRREAMREVSTDIAGKTYRGYASSEREIQVSVICPDARKIRLQVDGPARGNKAYRFSDNGVLKITAKEARMDNGAVQLAAVPRGAAQVTAGAAEVTLPPDTSLVAVNGSEVAGKQLVVMLSVVTYLNDNAFRIGNTAELEEMLTVNYVTLAAQ